MKTMSLIATLVATTNADQLLQDTILYQKLTVNGDCDVEMAKECSSNYAQKEEFESFYECMGTANCNTSFDQLSTSE